MRGPLLAVLLLLRVSTTSSGMPLNVMEAGDRVAIDSRLDGAKAAITASGGRYARGDRTLAVAKTYPDGVKLKDASGRTLWRAKISHGRMRIRRGEDAERYEFRHEPGGRIKVVQGGTEVGDVRPAELGARIEDAAGATLGVALSPPADDMAVLLCREMPPDLRAVLAAVLLARR